MLLSTLCFSFVSLTSALSVIPSREQYIFSNPRNDDGDRIPSVHESAIMARRILHLSKLGTLVTSFPDTSQSSFDDGDGVNAFENRPEGIGGSPIALMEYFADCEPDTGNPTLLAINIATPYKNYNAGSNISLAVRWWPNQKTIYAFDSFEDIPTPHTPAALPRFSLHGYLEPISLRDLWTSVIPACFLRTHPDSMLWQPGNDISHQSKYMRFVVQHVYWFGGFGDRARIGWLPIEEWRRVTMDEIAECRLPGEKPKDSRKDGL